MDLVAPRVRRAPPAAAWVVRPLAVHRAPLVVHRVLLVAAHRAPPVAAWVPPVAAWARLAVVEWVPRVAAWAPPVVEPRRLLALQAHLPPRLLSRIPDPR